MDDNLPSIIHPSVVVPEPMDAEVGDTDVDLAKKQLPYWNGLMRACHMSLTEVTSLSGFTRVIDNSIKVMKVQRELLGTANSRGARGVAVIWEGVGSLPD